MAADIFFGWAKIFLSSYIWRSGSWLRDEATHCIKEKHVVDNNLLSCDDGGAEEFSVSLA